MCTCECEYACVQMWVWMCVCRREKERVCVCVCVSLLLNTHRTHTSWLLLYSAVHSTVWKLQPRIFAHWCLEKSTTKTHIPAFFSRNLHTHETCMYIPPKYRGKKAHWRWRGGEIKKHYTSNNAVTFITHNQCVNMYLMNVAGTQLMYVAGTVDTYTLPLVCVPCTLYLMGQ